MDRFADRRFKDVNLDPGSAARADNLYSLHGELIFSSIFNQLSPPVLRWIADARGRLLFHEPPAAPFPGPSDAAIRGFDWRRLLDSDDRRSLLRAGAQSARPDPITVRLKGGDGQRRWAMVRMQRSMSRDGRTCWFGTIEDIHDRRDQEDRALEQALAESREHYRCSVELSPQVPWTASPDGGIEEVGPRWQELTGMAAPQAMGTGWLDALHPEDIQPTLDAWNERLHSGAPIDIDYRIRLRDDSFRWMRARAAARRDEQGNIVRWYGTVEDIHSQKLAQQAVEESEEHFRLAVQSARLGIWDYDVLSGRRSWSPEFREMLGLTAEHPATAELALSLVHPDDRAKLKAMMDAVAAQALPPHFEATLRIYRVDSGAMRWIRSTGWATRIEAGRPSRVVVTFLDVTDQRDAEERIRWAATHDPMTRMPNRALWQATLEAMAIDAQRSGAHFGLMLFDIDDLKRVNDSFGHDAGDALLSVFADRLAAVAPPDAVLGRLGGDEFGLIAASLVDSDAVRRFSQTLLDTVRQPFSFHGQLLDTGVSIGAAVFGEHGDEANDLFKAADLALYASKATGRSRLTIFRSELRAEAQQRSSMIHMARQVVSNDLVTPYYQPKVDMRTGRILGYEALLRWHHPRLGVQSPGSIAAAFDHGELAVALTDRMLDAVLHDLERWLRAGFDPGRVAVNASAADFAQNDFAEDVLNRLERHDIPPRHLEIEVTETVFLGRGTDQVARALDRFSRAGVRVALDDFGTGFASLSHLKQYPVDVLKIDRSFVSHIDEDEGDVAIVDAIVKLGSSFGMEVVAEGVETAAQAALLLHHGCLIGQGYHYGRPQPESLVLPGLALSV